LIGYMVSGFFASVAYQWYAYYLVGYGVSLWRMFEAESSVLAAETSPAKPVVKPDLYAAFQPEAVNPSS
jgi:hypothetical protein